MGNPNLFEYMQFDRIDTSDFRYGTEITLRDLFAAVALAGLLANPREDYAATTRDDKANEAWRQADAMLAAREGE